MAKTNGIPVVTGRREGARRFLVYGPESVGKTTLAAHAPNPVFIDLEDGSAELDVARYRFGDDVIPQAYDDVIGAIVALTASDHEFQTLIIDSLDRLESMIWDHVIKRDSGKATNLNKGGRRLESIESYGYGKGYGIALDEFRALLALLEQLRKRREMNVVFIGHTTIRPFKNPEGEDYDRYWLRVHASLGGQAKEWCDVVGFLCFDEGAGKLDSDQQRAKGWSTGRRLLKLTRTAAFDAKSRIAMPAEIELTADNPWAPFARAMAIGQSKDPKALLAEIADECKRLADESLTKKVQGACAKADAPTLARYLMELRNRQSTQENTNA